MKRLSAALIAFALLLSALVLPTVGFAKNEPEKDGIIFGGYFNYCVDSEYGFFGKFNSSDPTSITQFDSFDTVFAAEFMGGRIYAYKLDGTFCVGNADSMALYDVSNPYGSTITVLDMAYNHANDTMYALTSHAYVGTFIATVDIITGELNEYMPINESSILTGGIEQFANLAISTDGEAFMLSYGQNAKLYSVDLNAGGISLIGETGYGLQYVQSMAWDHNNNKLYWAQYYDAENNGLCEINPETGEAAYICRIGSGSEICGLFIENDLDGYVPEAPDAYISFIDGLTGEEISAYEVPYGASIPDIAFPEPPVHFGYEFTGWDYAGEPIFLDRVITANYTNPLAVTWDFNEEPANLGWSLIDADGDNMNWNWMQGTMGGFPYEGNGCMNSASYHRYAGALTPDNWLISPEISIPNEASIAELSFMMFGENGAAEVIGIYVSTDGGTSWSDELGYFVATDEYVRQSVDLADYVGCNIKVAFRHYDVTDLNSVDIDYAVINILPAQPSTPEPIDPTDAPDEPTSEPVDPTDAPIEPTIAPTDPADPSTDPSDIPASPSPIPAPSTGGAAFSLFGIAALFFGFGISLLRKKNN